MKNTLDKVITIDGPSGVGKGTLARFLAKKLNWPLLDSGAIYRALAYFCHKNNIVSSDEQAVAKAALELPVSFIPQDGITKVLVANKDATKEIRGEAIGMLASKVSAYSSVRENLMALQRAFNKGNGLIADGRDMGTIVFPDAKIKLFLDALSEVRAKRRYEELIKQGIKIDYATVLQQVVERDFRDRNRTVAPLKPAKDAIVIDTSISDINQVQEKVLEIIKKNDLGC